MTLFEVITKEVDAEVRRIQENLAGGQAKDYPEYRYLCGIVHGLLGIRAYVDGLQRNLEGEE